MIYGHYEFSSIFINFLVSINCCQDLLVFLQLASQTAVYVAEADMGAYGGPTQKPHRFYSNHAKVAVSS